MMQYFPENSSLNGLAHKLFKDMDRDNSGFIDSGEFLHAVWQLQQSKEGSKTRLWNGHPSELFAVIDTNQNDRLDMDEWMEYLRGMWEALGEKKLRPMLELHCKLIENYKNGQAPTDDHHHHHHHHQKKEAETHPKKQAETHPKKQSKAPPREEEDEEEDIDQALLKAAEAGQAARIRNLLADNADPNIHGAGFGNTPLQIVTLANKHSSLECVKALVEGRADVNTLNSKGASALMQAASHGETKVVSILLECKADTNIKNMMGSTALDVAKQENQNDIIELLKQHGAQVGDKKPVCDFVLDASEDAHLPTTGEVFDKHDFNK